MARRLYDLMDSELVNYIGEFPEVPDAQRPRKLYVNYAVPPSIEATVTDKGWQVQDIRLLDELEAVAATLEGVRTGSIALDGRIQRFLELEQRIYEKGGVPDADDSDIKTPVEDLLGFNQRPDVNLATGETKTNVKIKKKRKGHGLLVGNAVKNRIKQLRKAGQEKDAKWIESKLAKGDKILSSEAPTVKKGKK